MTSDEGRLPNEVLVHICIYCHQDKGSVVAANACEKEHEKTMSPSQLYHRHAVYIANFVRPFKPKKKEK